MQRILLQNEQNMTVFRRVSSEVNDPSTQVDHFDITLGLFINNQKILQELLSTLMLKNPAI